MVRMGTCRRDKHQIITGSAAFALIALCLLPRFTSAGDRQIIITADSGRGDFGQFSELALTLEVTDDRLVLDTFSANLNGGTLRAEGELAFGTEVRSEFSAHGENIDLAKISGIEQHVAALPARIDLAVASTATTVNELLPHMVGTLDVEARSGRLVHGDLGLLTKDLSAGLLSFATGGNEAKSREVECLVIDVDMAEKKAGNDPLFVLQTGDAALVGRGSISLVDGALDLRFKPQSTGELALTGLNAASVVAIQGTVFEPEVTADAVGLLKQGASLGAAVATLGLSKIAETVIDTVATDDTNPCGGKS